MADAYSTPESQINDGDKAAWQQRVIEERKELEAKMNRLSIFLCGPDAKKLHLTDLYLLQKQHHWMAGYNAVLTERIERFKA